jgi:hypothetical protein
MKQVYLNSQKKKKKKRGSRMSRKDTRTLAVQTTHGRQENDA